MAKSKFTVDEIVDFLRKEEENETIEGRLLTRKLLRELYKKLGSPQEKDFPSECETAGSYWKKVDGYTTYIRIMSQREMENINNDATYWNVIKPSMTKVNIVERYTRAGWHCTVQAYNVMCVKYVKHPKHKNIWVRFYSSRDCNKYEYVILREE